MKIYIDFDDVICETAKYFTILAAELFGVRVPYSEVQFFNLQKTFELEDTQYAELMRVGHTAEKLLAYEETPEASRTIQRWLEEGHEIFIITGRPFEAYDASKKWLERHGLGEIPLYCVDKYGRESFIKEGSYTMTLEQLYQMPFDFAVEDSPNAFEHVLHFENCRVAVFDRPWNQKAEFPNENFIRCADWREIDRALQQWKAKQRPF